MDEQVQTQMMKVENCDKSQGPACKLVRPKPEKPLDSDCCGNGCTPCVFDTYDKELVIWERECLRIQRGDECGEGGDQESQNKWPELNEDEYTAFTINETTKEGEDSIRIKCLLAPDKSLGLKMGQHISIRSAKADGPWAIRSYTPISPMDAKGYFELAIKVYPKGEMSRHLASLQPGEKFEARGPDGGLEYHRNKYSRILMLAAGTGVCPMCQIIQAVLADEREDTRLRLLYACRTYTQLIAQREMAEWRRFWNFSVCYVLSQEPDPPTSTYKHDEEIVRGHIDRDMVVRELGDDIKSTLVLICGTPNFEADMIDIVKELGVERNNLHKF